MELLSGGGQATSLRRFPPVPRVRPGESPVWQELFLDGAQVREWRRRARSFGLGVDAWLAILIEFALVRDVLDDLRPGLLEAVVTVAAAEDEAPVLAPTIALRNWLATLRGRYAEVDVRDELPSVVLPERLVAQLPPAGVDASVHSAIQPVEHEALACDRAAAQVGLTMETWMLRHAAAHLCAARR